MQAVSFTPVRMKRNALLTRELNPADQIQNKDRLSFAGKKTLPVIAEPYVSQAYVKELKELLENFPNKKALQRLIDHKWKVVVIPIWDGEANAQKITSHGTLSASGGVLPRSKTIVLHEIQYHPELKVESAYQTRQLYGAVAQALNYDLAMFPKQSLLQQVLSKPEQQASSDFIRISDDPICKRLFEDYLQSLPPDAGLLDHPAVTDKFGFPAYLQDYYTADEMRARLFDIVLETLLKHGEEGVSEDVYQTDLPDMKDFALKVYREHLS